jgi:hypothetical protein
MALPGGPRLSEVRMIWATSGDKILVEPSEVFTGKIVFRKIKNVVALLKTLSCLCNYFLKIRYLNRFIKNMLL